MIKLANIKFHHRFTNLIPLSVLLLLLPLQSAMAQQAVPTYKIEVIVFESFALKGWTEEYWPDEIEIPYTENSTPLSLQQESPLWIKTLSNDLDREKAKLNKQGYRVLFHQTWSQLAYPNKNAPTVVIENNQGKGSHLIGNVRLYKTRYAHVNFDLEFERRIPGKILDAFMQNQKITADYMTPTHWRFNLNESRKIRYGELHYIDHPLFGVLVQVEMLDDGTQN